MELRRFVFWCVLLCFCFDKNPLKLLRAIIEGNIINFRGVTKR